MKAIKIFLLHCMVFSCTATAIPAMSTETGFLYGKEFWGNTNLVLFEEYVRVPLPFKKEFSPDLKLFSAVEMGMGAIKEEHSDNDPAARISVMPQIVLNPHSRISCFFGLGTGVMMGNTEFTKHNLGGDLLFASKLGVQFLLGQHWRIGYCYFHQSNAGIYEYNASLNMHQLAFSYSF